MARPDSGGVPTVKQRINLLCGMLLRPQQLHPGIGKFLLPAGGKMQSVKAIDFTNVVVRVRSREYGFAVQREACGREIGLCSDQLGVSCRLDLDT